MICRFASGRKQKPLFLWFLYLWTCPRAPKPILFIFWDIRIPKTNQENPGTFCKQLMFVNVNVLKIQHFDIFWKAGHRKVPLTRLIKSWKSWIWHQYLSKNMKWKFCNMDQISFKNMEDPNTTQHTDSHPCTLAAAPRKRINRNDQYTWTKVRRQA